MTDTAPDIRARIAAAMKARGWNNADLSRASKVPYHALDKYLKGTSATTSHEKMQAICNALGIKADGEAEWDRFRAVFFQPSPEQQRFLAETVEGLAARNAVDH